MAEKVHLFNLKLGKRVEVVSINLTGETITFLVEGDGYTYTAPYKDFLESVCIVSLHT